MISYVALPAEFTGIFTDEPERVVKNWYMFFCVAVGLWGGLVIGIVTEYFTSNRYQPVQARARRSEACLVLSDSCTLPVGASMRFPNKAWRLQSCQRVGNPGT